MRDGVYQDAEKWSGVTWNSEALTRRRGEAPAGYLGQDRLEPFLRLFLLLFLPLFFAWQAPGAIHS